MLIYFGEPHYELVVAQEETGYLITSIYGQQNGELVLKNAGRIPNDEQNSDHDDDEMVRRLQEYWELSEGDYIILDR